MEQGAQIESPDIDALSARPSETGNGNSVKRSPSAVRNAILNWVGFGAEVAVAFFLTPYLIARLGAELYGVWLVIGSLAGYFGMLDFGFNNAIGRFVALHRGRNQHDDVIRTVNTAVGILAIVGTIAFALICATAPFLSFVVDIPEGQLTEARIALVIVGLNLAASFTLGGFESLLWGYERFDLKNMVDATAIVLRALVVAFLVHEGYGLIAMASCTLAVTLTTGLLKALLCFRVAAPFTVSWNYVSLKSWREMAGFGFWQFAVSWSRLTRTHLSPLTIGRLLGPVSVTSFSNVSRLVSYAGLAMSTTVSVVGPRLTAYVGQGDAVRQNQLLMKTGRICAAFALYAVSGLVLFGRSFMTLWVGEEFAWTSVVLAILAAGELLPMIVAPCHMALFANARQRTVAFQGIAECVVGLGLGAVLANWFGLVGFAIPLALASTGFRGVLILNLTQDLLQVSAWAYLRETVVPVALRSLVPIFVALGLIAVRPPGTWLEFLAYCTGYSLLLAAFVLPGLAEVQAMIGATTSRWLGRAVEDA